MPSECIHGFDEGLCDICYPKAPVAKPRAASRSVAPQRVSRATSARATATRATAARATPAKAPPVNLLDQRVFHVTHVRNLVGIVDSGAVLAFEQSAESDPAAALDVAVDLSSTLARELRATVEVGATADAGAASRPVPVSAHVPWFLSADASVWQELRRGAAESRWSTAARAAASTDFVVLVSTVRALTALGGVTVADGDAAGTFTQFATDTDQALRMLARLHNTEQLLEAEVLVSGSVPFAAVQLIGVANEPQRDRVRQVLDAGASARPKVAVYPPWFAAPE